MRGKVREFLFFRFIFGITPAYAGKSTICTNADFQSWDHPRLCGEKQPPANKSNFRIGSPPPMRGKVITTRKPQRRLGITPAYAGKSGGANPRNHVSKDHPRLCGEKQPAHLSTII